jgi:DNA-binding transcriptional MerR regulator
MEEYTINGLAKIAGVSARTLRYYEECGLLRPRRDGSNGYRIYGRPEVGRLQQILFYRELGVGLASIKQILSAPGFEPLPVLNGHLAALKARRGQIDILIRNVEKSIQEMKGEISMSDTERFEGFKQKLIDDNERQYGEELRAKHGDEIMDRSNAQLKGMTKEQYEESERLTQELGSTLKAALAQGDPAGPLAQKACGLHKEWLCFYWPDGQYSKEMHLGMAQMYVADERFKAYYDNIAPGMAEFLRDAIQEFCK